MCIFNYKKHFVKNTLRIVRNKLQSFQEVLLLLHNKIVVCRAEKSWTQEELAKRVGVSRQTIATLEKNKYNPSLILAFKIANIFEKSITDVFDYQEE